MTALAKAFVPPESGAPIVTVAFKKFFPDPALSFNISIFTTDPPEMVAVACALSPTILLLPDIVTVGADEYPVPPFVTITFSILPATAESCTDFCCVSNVSSAESTFSTGTKLADKNALVLAALNPYKNFQV